MLIHSIGRAANSTNSLHLVASRSGGVLAQQSASNSTSCRHQRRRSSSKTSHPPGSSNSSEQTPGDASSKSTVTERRDQNHRAERRSNGVVARRRTKTDSNAEAAAIKARDDGFANAPAVPSTQHLNQADIHLSSLFALHRPISLTSSIPPSSTQIAFKNIFETSRSSQKPWQNMMAFTVQQDGVSAGDQSSKAGAGRKRTNGTQMNEAVYHVDGPPSVEQLVKQFRPFQKPPAPIPFDEADSQHLDEQSQSGSQSVGQASLTEDTAAEREEGIETRTQKKMFKTTLTVEEVTHPSGEKTYSSTASPIVEQQHAEGQERPNMAHPSPLRQPFLSRMRARATQQADRTPQADRRNSSVRQTYFQGSTLSYGEPGVLPLAEELNDCKPTVMELISVKRQRRLKMKKHKYKKLMRRTRNLRRREGRN